MRSLALGIVLQAGIVSFSPTAGTPPTIAQYAQSIHAIRTSLDALPPSRGASEGELNRIRRQLRALGSLRLPDGRILQTDTPALAGELRPQSLQLARSQLDQLDDALHVQPSASADPARLRALDAVLRDPRFHPQKSLRQLLEDWINRTLARLLSALFGHAQVSSTAASVFGILFLALVAGFAFLAARGALRRMVVEAGTDEEVGEPVRSRQAEERAARLSQAGDYRSALRYLVLSTLLALQERDVLTLRPGLTNRELLRLLRQPGQPGHTRSDEIAEALQVLIDAFDRVWYGHQPLGAAEYARCQELARQALAAPEERAA